MGNLLSNIGTLIVILGPTPSCCVGFFTMPSGTLPTSEKMKITGIVRPLIAEINSDARSARISGDRTSGKPVALEKHCAPANSQTHGFQ